MIDTLYPINLTTPADITLEAFTKVPGNVETPLGIVPRAFLGGTDFKVYTDSAGSTQLTENVHYELTITDDYYTARKGANVYKSFKIIDPTYYNANLWFSYKVIGSYIDAEYAEAAAQEGQFRNAIIDPLFDEWNNPAGTSFVDPPDISYTADMWKAERSTGGGTADNFTISRSTFVEDEYGPYSLKIDVTTASATAAAISGIFHEIRNRKNLENEIFSMRARVYVPAGVDCQILIFNGTQSRIKSFTGIGEWQDVVFENQQFTVAATLLNAYFRISPAAAVTIEGEYYISAFQLNVGPKALPIIRQKKEEVKNEVLKYYEVFKTSRTSLLQYYPVVVYTADTVTVQGKMFPKQNTTGSVSLGGVVTTDWAIAQGGSDVAGFSLTSATQVDESRWRMVFTKVAHGLTSGAYLVLKNTAAAAITFNNR